MARRYSCNHASTAAEFISEAIIDDFTMAPDRPAAEAGAPFIVHADVLDTPENPFTGGQLRSERCALVVRDGVIIFRGPLAQARQDHPDAPVHTVSGVLLPGLVDTHVHFPQLRIIGGLGMPLLEWLDRCALPEEARMASTDYAAAVAGEFVRGLIAAGTTSALVFGAHYAGATDALLAAADAAEYRMTAGLVVGDRNLRPDLHTTPEQARADAAELITRWHDRGRLRYAVTPRFALSATPELLDACRESAQLAPGVFVTSHLNENPAEIEAVAALFPDAHGYTDVYQRHGLLGPRSVLAHSVHTTPAELHQLGETGTWVAHCPSSNSALGSGLFPLRSHLDAGVQVALGSDVGGGTGLSLFKEGLQAYFHQQLRPDGVALTPAHLLYLATTAGALALDRPEVGHLSVGQEFDAIAVEPDPDSPLGSILRHSTDESGALAAIFATGTTGDISTVWMHGTINRH